MATFATGLVAVLVLGLICAGSFEIVSTLYAFDQRSEALELPVWIPQSFITIGFAMMAFMIVLRFVCALTGQNPSGRRTALRIGRHPMTAVSPFCRLSFRSCCWFSACRSSWCCWSRR